MNKSIVRVMLLSLVAAACSSDDDDGADGVDAAGGGQDAALADAPAADASAPDAAGPPNARVVGTWELQSAGSTCGISFASGFTGAAVEGSDYNFKLTLNDGSQAPPVLSCGLSVVTPNTFTCSNFSQAGVIPPTCNVSLLLANISGSLAGDAVEITASVTRSSPNCGAALNCGPLTHLSNGMIVP